MQIIEYKYLKVNNRMMTGASVQIGVSLNTIESTRILMEVEDGPFRSQGLTEGGHGNWVKSANAALNIAVNNSSITSNLDIVVKKLEGRILLETNNAAIGVACILALWKYLKFQPSKITMNKIHEFVVKDWSNDISKVPNFNLIF